MRVLTFWPTYGYFSLLKCFATFHILYGGWCNGKQAHRTAMDRSNIGNSWNREKLVLAAVYRSLAGKINQNSHSQIIISIDIYQSVPHGINQLQRESWKVTSVRLFILRRRRSECFLLFVNTWNVHKHTDA